MKFWNDMQTKWGFADGDEVPDGVEEYRQAYCDAVNALAEDRGSLVRVRPWNRPGLHNPYLVLFVPAYEPFKVTGDHPLGDIAPDQMKPDKAMEDAIEEAYAFDPDSYVEVSARYRKSTMEKCLVKMINEPKG